VDGWMCTSCPLLGKRVVDPCLRVAKLPVRRNGPQLPRELHGDRSIRNAVINAWPQ